MGCGTPRGMQDRVKHVLFAFWLLCEAMRQLRDGDSEQTLTLQR
jgi:hypothetical protein